MCEINKREEVLCSMTPWRQCAKYIRAFAFLLRVGMECGGDGNVVSRMRESAYYGENALNVTQMIADLDAGTLRVDEALVALRSISRE